MNRSAVVNRNFIISHKMTADKTTACCMMMCHDMYMNMTMAMPSM